MRGLPQARYNREALEILFRGKNIAEVLDMTVDQASSSSTRSRASTKLDTLDVGLGYIKVGQLARAPMGATPEAA